MSTNRWGAHSTAAHNESLINGIPVLTLRMPHLSTISFGIFITAGSRDEEPERSGLFHFLEHLVFKGTANRSQREIARVIDRLGGHFDAYTSREITGYSALVVKERLDEAFDLLADITLNSTFPEQEVERERGVIHEEIRMSEDNPAEFIQERMYPLIFGAHPLGRSITGSSETVNAISRADIVAAQESFYRPPRLIIAASGAVEHRVMEELVSRYFGTLAPTAAPKRPSLPPARVTPPPVTMYGKELEQAHLLFAGPGLGMNHPGRHALAILDTIMGGSVSSRLFQSVREERGLAYSVSSFYEQYAETGLFALYAASAPERLVAMWQAMVEELRAIRTHPPTDAEVDLAKRMELDNLRMAYESPSARLTDLVDRRIYFGDTQTLEQALDDVERVTPASVRELAESLDLGGAGYALLVVGPSGKRMATTLREICV